MSETISVLSPLPGLFYRKPSPTAEVFVKEGDHVKVGDVVGLVEVMKSFHEVRSEVSGVVVQFLIENEGSVDIGQAILEVKA